MGDRQDLRAWTEDVFGGESSTSEGYGIIIIIADEGKYAKPRQNDKDETNELQRLRRSNQVQQEKRNSTRKIVKQIHGGAGRGEKTHVG
ncbi:hypothetical protein N7493_002488 [Penicillium malachiteum]|uniref:Uncharacterized protein n=1 Tax=Penicillium malachiteum TaxID=1324776 RepID=A0AAD6HRY6_9EURO|nr:hypothetical protein N7493_002488 [Penicillium malachiteum]